MIITAKRRNKQYIKGKQMRKTENRTMDAEVMSVREVAEYLRISVYTVYRLAEQGKLPGRKVGKHWRFHRGAIISWLTTQHEVNNLYGTTGGYR